MAAWKSMKTLHMKKEPKTVNLIMMENTQNDSKLHLEFPATDFSFQKENQNRSVIFTLKQS